MRHAENLKTVNTCEGTHGTRAQIFGRALARWQGFF